MLTARVLDPRLQRFPRWPLHEHPLHELWPCQRRRPPQAEGMPDRDLPSLKSWPHERVTPHLQPLRDRARRHVQAAGELADADVAGRLCESLEPSHMLRSCETLSVPVLDQR
jgi:hypothetical protein